MTYASSEHWDYHRHYKPMDPDKVAPMLEKFKLEDEIRSNTRLQGDTHIDSNLGKWKYVPTVRTVEKV
ncbi:hypothetical protein PTE30175_00512 [Pandoraea terrae]|uniref:Uncharacterized protein n=1 Tax=Pandoraea terrae TaxID=1537710 RepID=A0A5E4S397_9BURK|nr:hypothetical protein PTE30175_00512 [Pandoraea terrae]